MTTVAGCFLIVLILSTMAIFQSLALFPKRYYDTSETTLLAFLVTVITLVVSLSLAPIIDRHMRASTGMARLFSLIIGYIIAVVFMLSVTSARFAFTFAVCLFPQYGLFHWALYRAHALTSKNLIILIAATVLILPLTIILVGEASDLRPSGLILLFFFGVVGFGTSLGLAHRFRLFS